ncbi:hypothetical protein SADUNF_Sadunf05G0031000 [Salix dunnii]|uniref:Uncharacterized protein n=1 Tax=Salix dunnii TaxID=1413687 RepID=A0A835MYA6_9ROSI|nr:hypothetical protein SADUNF_Sadunf05G0031000 [Salix dunnii]
MENPNQLKPLVIYLQTPLGFFLENKHQIRASMRSDLVETRQILYSLSSSSFTIEEIQAPQVLEHMVSGFLDRVCYTALMGSTFT